MRIGFFGPSEGDHAATRDALEFLINDAAVEQAIYLGPSDDPTPSDVIDAWTRELADGGQPEETFLCKVANLASHGTSEQLDSLLAEDAAIGRLSCVRRLPPPPARAVEVIDGKIVLMVYDKAILDEDDIANANLILYGKADEVGLRRFGHRYFFTPGPLRGRKIAILDAEEPVGITLAVFALSGAPVWRESLQQPTMALRVQA